MGIAQQHRGAGDSAWHPTRSGSAELQPTHRAGITPPQPERRPVASWTLGTLFVGMMLALAAATSGRAAHAQQTLVRPVERLWPARAPGALGDGAEHESSLTVYLAPSARANSAAVVVAPGGGYGVLASNHEGAQVAQWLNSLGVTAFVLKYRLGPRYQHPTMLTDGQQAIRTVRTRAGEWKVDPNRIGILGFSAGGHLASTVGTQLDLGDRRANDPVARASSRPDFMLLIYPVITMSDPYTHAGSRRNLLGSRPSPEFIDQLSSERQVAKDTPPTFLVHTTDDAVVPVENSLLFYRALRAAGVPAELHIYRAGPHGFGLAPDDRILAGWPKLGEAWMRGLGLFEP